MMSDRFDVIIVGAGPAGSTCARACARAGLATLLLDQDAFPRPKPCGGALSARALSLLDFPLPPPLVEQECRGIRVQHGRQAVERRADRPIAFLVDRAAFDGYLAEQAVQAGAVFRQGERVTQVLHDEDAASVSTAAGSYRASYLVGADGSNSVVARQVRPPFGRHEIMATLVTTVRGAAARPSSCSDVLDMRFGIAPLGYGWVFPHGDACSVGIMGLAADFHEVPRHFADFCATAGLPVQRARGHTIPLGGIRRPVTNGRILLAGDAAGFADPFQGEGMVHAIHSGLLAAEAIIGALRNRTDAGRRYAMTCERQIRRHLQVALRMARTLERHPELYIEIFFGNGPALDRYLDIASGKSDYRRFQRWLLPRLPQYLLRYWFQRKPLV